MTAQAYRIAARPQALEVTACAGVLNGSMKRLVIDKNLTALREFHAIGIPLDHALDFAVQKGSMPLIDELLNNLRVVPSENTLNRAMRRGQTIRNMFLARVTPTIAHLNTAVLSEHFDTAHLLLDRGIEPDPQTVGVFKPSAKLTEDRRVFVDRLVNTMSLKVLSAPGVLTRLPLFTSPAQFERALDRVPPLEPPAQRRLLSECLRASAPTHARSLINRGIQFLPEHLDVCGDQTAVASDTNPTKELAPILTTVLETAIEEGVLFEGSDDMYHLVRPMVSKYCFTNQAVFLRLCDLFARACKSNSRPYVGRFIMTEAGTLQRRKRDLATLDDLNNLIDTITETFTRDRVVEPEGSPFADVGPLIGAPNDGAMDLS